MSTDDETKPDTLVDANVLLQEGLALAGDLHVKGDRQQATRQMLLTLIRYQATVDPVDTTGSPVVCAELLEGVRGNADAVGRPTVEVDRGRLYTALNEMRLRMIEARKSFDSGDHLRAAFFNAMAHYNLLQIIDPEDTDRHLAVAFDSVTAFADALQGARLPEWLRPLRAKTTGKGRPKGTRDDLRTWSTRKTAAVVRVWLIRRGAPPEEAEEEVAAVLRKHGLKDVTGRAVRSWCEKLEEASPTIPPSCIEHFREWTTKKGLLGDKKQMLEFLARELDYRGSAPRRQEEDA